MRNGSLLKYFRTFPVILLSVSGIACSNDNNDEPDIPTTPTPQIIVMYAPGGLGDQGYNDRILAGVQNFKKTYHDDVEMYQYSPGSLEDAGRLLIDWLSLPQSETPALFVVGSSDYENLLYEILEEQSLTPNKRLLLFESDGRENLPVTTFRLSIYGASYLAGVTAAELLENDSNALILLAHPGDNVIAKAETGFRDGFKDTRETLQAAGEVYTEYLAQDWSGYISTQSAYQRMSDWAKSYDYIFPVAGGSNQGIYRYTREYPDAPLTAGMDIDQSGLSRNITGCVIKHIDRVVYKYMEKWLTTGELPASSVFGLESGYTDWLLSQYFPQCQPAIEAARTNAIRKEAKEL